MSDAHCTQTHRIEAAEKRVDTLFGLLERIENKFDAKLDLILMQMSKLAVLEANHTTHNAEMQKLSNEVSTCKAAISDVTAFRHHTEGMAKMAVILWGALSGLVGFLLVKVLFP